MRMLKCPDCGSALERTPSGWYCKICALFHNVERGKVGPPLLGPARGAGKAPEAGGEMERIRREHGVEVTPEGLEFLRRHKSFRGAVGRLA